MKILAIDTSCDETAAAVTRGTTVLSNVIWSQASEHARFGGVMPSLAKRMHEERIDFVIEKALRQAQCGWTDVDAVAVTTGPGLAIALEVGIRKAKEIARELKEPLIPVNHIEGHVLSPLAQPLNSKYWRSQRFSSKIQNSNQIQKSKSQVTNVSFPAVGLVVSGGHTELILIKNIGKYEILARTQDDALGEALDKAARILGLGYPGGAILEKMAREGNPKAFLLPLPMARRKDSNSFSYSGLKTALFRLVASLRLSQSLSRQQIHDLAASFQNRAFEHLVRVMGKVLRAQCSVLKINDLLVGGGVAANIELRKRLRKLGKELGLKMRLPYSAKLVGDNAAMIGVAAGLRVKAGCPVLVTHYEEVDRRPRWIVEEEFK